MSIFTPGRSGILKCVHCYRVKWSVQSGEQPKTLPTDSSLLVSGFAANLLGFRPNSPSHVRLSEPMNGLGYFRLGGTMILS